MGSGHELGVDLSELWHAGKTLLPDVAAQFDDAVGDLRTALNDEGAWWRGGGLGSNGGGYGAATQWQELLGTVQGYLAQTYNNLYYTGDALVMAANQYATDDAEARATFEARKKQMGG